MKRALAFLVCLSAASAFAGERTYDKTFSVDAGASFYLDSHKGTIRIRTHSEPVIRATARIIPGEGGEADSVERIVIKERVSQRRVSLEVEYDQPSGGWGGLFTGSHVMPLVEWDIALPDDLELEIDSHKSEFDIEVPAGRIEIASHKGVGTIRGVRNDFDLDTHKGQFEIEILELHDLSVDTHKGDIEVSIRGASDFSVRGDSHRGRLRFSGRDIPVEREDRESVVDYRAGSGNNRIRISTHKGDVHLRFVD